jgi:hypothetical protein
MRRRPRYARYNRRLNRRDESSADVSLRRLHEITLPADDGEPPPYENVPGGGLRNE